MERGGPQRRRIDRVSADDFLEGLADRSAEEVRTMRDECRAEEAQVSYHRRLLQGRIDVARAEQDRRRGDDQTSLVDALPSILAGSDTSGGRTGQLQSRYSPVDPPPETPARRAEDVAANDSALSRLPDLDNQELDEVVDELAERERSLSDLRRRILDNLDALQDELVRRYRAGEVSSEDVDLDRAPDEGAGEQRE